MSKEEKEELEALQDLDRFSLSDIREVEKRYNQSKYIEEMCDCIFNEIWKEEWEEIE
jgi:hypothetical protein